MVDANEGQVPDQERAPLAPRRSTATDHDHDATRDPGCRELVRAPVSRPGAMSERPDGGYVVPASSGSPPRKARCLIEGDSTTEERDVEITRLTTGRRRLITARLNTQHHRHSDQRRGLFYGAVGARCPLSTRRNGLGTGESRGDTRQKSDAGCPGGLTWRRSPFR